MAKKNRSRASASAPPVGKKKRREAARAAAAQPIEPATPRRRAQNSTPTEQNGPVAPAKAKTSGATAPRGSSDAATLAQAFDDWKNGAQIHTLATQTGLKRSKLRRTLIALAGGKIAFKALRQTGAGGTVEPFGGKRAEPRTREAKTADDSRLAMLTKTDAKLDGWTHEWLRTPLGTFPILVSPDKLTRYGRANATEKADLLFDVQTAGIPHIRCKILSASALLRHTKREAETIERGEAAITRTRATKRAKRKARRAATTEN